MRIPKNITFIEYLCQNERLAKVIHWLGYQKIKLYNLMKYGQTDMFVATQIETTNTCNLKCVYCPMAYKPRKTVEKMDDKLFKKIIQDLKELKFSGSLGLHGYSETLLDEKLYERVKYVHKELPKCNIKLATNGVLLTIEKYEKLKKAGVGEIVVSRHTKHPLTNVIDLFDHKKKNNDNLPLSYDDSIVSDVGLFNRAGTINEKDLKEFKKITFKKCIWNVLNCTIDVKGNIILCCNDYDSEMILGNINKNTIREIWNKPKNKKIRSWALNGEFDKIPICKKCTSW
jgi:radical SAM protein with 4Fe4S-binding SPASM domain